MPEAKVGINNMNKVLSLIDRDNGEARSFVITDLRMSTIAPIIEANVAREAWLMTDEAARYTGIGWNFAAHGRVNHSAGEYGRGRTTSHQHRRRLLFDLQAGHAGVYQHCSSTPSPLRRRV